MWGTATKKVDLSVLLSERGPCFDKISQACFSRSGTLSLNMTAIKTGLRPVGCVWRPMSGIASDVMFCSCVEQRDTNPRILVSDTIQRQHGHEIK